MIFEKYYAEVVDVLEKIKNAQKKKIELASKMMAKVMLSQHGKK